MTIKMTIIAALMAGPAFASGNCFVPITDWQPRSVIEALASEQGWDLRRIRIDDGCYEMIGLDAHGRPARIKLHPGTLEIIEIEHENEYDE